VTVGRKGRKDLVLNPKIRARKVRALDGLGQSEGESTHNSRCNTPSSAHRDDVIK
jgi:hypothetical protein